MLFFYKIYGIISVAMRSWFFDGNVAEW